MNRGLRKRHRRLAVFAAIAAPAVFAAALLARPAPAPTSAIPTLSGNIVAGDAVKLAVNSFALDGTPMTARLYRENDGTDAGLRVVLSPADGHAVGGADVLVYWHRGGASGDTIPDDALLVGTLAGPQSRTFELPGEAATGELLFYSLAQQRLYAERWELQQ